MDVLPIWAMWLSLGVILLIAEIFTATFFMFCFGVGALATTFAAWLGFGQSVQWSVFLATSAIFVFLSRVLAERYSGEPERRAGVDRFIGERAVVIEEVDSLRGTGRVRALHEEWRVDSREGVNFAVNDTVVIVDVRGTHLVIAAEDNTQSMGAEG